MYHATSLDRVRSIMEQGLRTDADGWDTKWVWLFDEPEYAVTMAEAKHFTIGAVIAVDVDGLDIVPDPHPGWGSMRPGWDEHAFAHAGTIEPSRLSVVNRATLTP